MRLVYNDSIDPHSPKFKAAARSQVALNFFPGLCVISNVISQAASQRFSPQRHFSRETR